MRYLRRFVLGSALMLSIGSLCATNQSGVMGHGASGHAHEATKKAPSFLFVVSAKKALLSHKNGKHTLTIKKDDLDKVIEFSDRP